MDKRIIAVIAALVVIGVGAAYYSYSPQNALSKTFATAEFNQVALHLNEPSRTIFIVEMPITNPTGVPVTINEAHYTLLVDGVDYQSRELQNDPVTIAPGTTLKLTRMVQVTGSPIGTQQEEQVSYTLDITCELVGSAESIVGSATMDNVVEAQRSWTYSIGANFD